MTKSAPTRSKKKLNKEDRRMLAQQVITTGHLTAGALVFKQIFSGASFNFPLAILGIILLAWSYTWALILMKGGEEQCSSEH